MRVNGVTQDFGTLSARTVVTNADGIATVVYTAPPATPLFGTCFGLAGTCIDIVATATGTNFDTASPQAVSIRLVPPGVILPPAGTPTAAFNFSPTSVNAKSAVLFDASASAARQRLGGRLSATPGPSATAAAATAKPSRTPSAIQARFNVTLTVTNDRGLTASTSQAVTVAGGTLPTPTFTFSPTLPRINEAVFFNASASTAGAGHTITAYRWDFGDGSATGTGVTTSHTYAVSGTYNVVLTVTDEAGQTATSTPTGVAVGSGNPTAVLLVTKTGGRNVTADGNGSTASGTSTIATYTFLWGDGTAPTGPQAGPSAPHTFAVAGTYTVTLPCHRQPRTHRYDHSDRHRSVTNGRRVAH